jgi:hypothetical protein
MLSGMIAGGMTAVSPNKWLSGDLQNVLAKPYTRDLLINPVMINIIFPYDGATLAVSTIDVEGVVSDPVATVNVNGTKASVSDNGRFMAKGVSLSSGINQITASATTIMGSNASQTISVNYQSSQVSPMNISITYPSAGTTINRPATMVRGTFTSDADEISIKVNGMAADIYGNQFVINNMPLMDGDNVIIANAIDSNGAVGRAEVTVKADTIKSYITLSANITSGIPQLTTYFQVSTETPNQTVGYQMDFDGDGVIDFTGDTFENMSFTYTTEGIYYPTVMVTDDQGKTYTDSIAITVLNKEAIDALLKGKWEGMKGALLTGNIEKGLSYFIPSAQGRYREAFQVIIEELSQIVSAMQPIELIYLAENVAKYRINRVQDINGQQGTFSYYIYFMKDAIGIWKVDRF